MKITQKYKDYETLVSPHQYKFVEDDFEVLFYQSRNGDLNFVVNSRDLENKTLEIKKEENYLLYKLVDDFYNSLEDYKDKFGYDELFETGIFSWKSDAPANELAINEPFIYNYLNIINENDTYKFIFVNNIKTERFVVEINTDRSRYGFCRFPIWNLFNRLKEIFEPYRQITIDEYLYQKSLTKH